MDLQLLCCRALKGAGTCPGNHIDRAGPEAVVYRYLQITLTQKKPNFSVLTDVTVRIHKTDACGSNCSSSSML